MRRFRLAQLEQASIVILPNGEIGYVGFRSRLDKRAQIVPVNLMWEVGQIVTESWHEVTIVELVLTPHELAKRYLTELLEW